MILCKTLIKSFVFIWPHSNLGSKSISWESIWLIFLQYSCLRQWRTADTNNTLTKKLKRKEMYICKAMLILKKYLRRPIIQTLRLCENMKWKLRQSYLPDWILKACSNTHGESPGECNGSRCLGNILWSHWLTTKLSRDFSSCKL